MIISVFLLSLLTATGVQAHVQRRATVVDCLSTAGVPRSVAGSANFTQAIKPFNLRLPFTPVAVATPSTVAQVQAAVACGAQYKLAVTAKGGGHSYASHGIGGENGHLVVDMKLFTSVSVDSTTQIASIGTGSRLGNVAIALFNQGQRMFSHGTCPGVGIGGHVGGGGYGYASHTYGLALDNLVEATVVLANSTVVTASTTKNSDLFWAIRGAGASFGIITQYKFQTFPAPSSNTVFSYNYNFNQAQAAAMHKALQNYANTTMPAEMNMRMLINANSFALLGVYYGSQDNFKKAIAPLLAQAPFAGVNGQISTMGWLDTLTNYAYASLSTPLDYDVHETFFSKSLMTVNLTDAALSAFWAYWNANVKSNSRAWFLIIDLHGGPTSAISKVADSATAYAHRNALLKYEFYDRVYSGSYPSNGFSMLNGWVSSITSAMSSTTFGMYMNYADPSLSTTEAHNFYWLKHYDALTKVKKAYDPTLVFSNPQSVMLT
ncbi:glucooligosaccharide oxidase [Rhexocercosporidium sp. MPI-PUGE-AT-0058]|nr:glucooligosaccharide oxidase [Rhexocercosporidium sp. MPI-PUGE-AT-0058]